MQFQQKAQLDHGIQLVGINIAIWQVLITNHKWRAR
jgi:hypothetical protein